MQIGCCVAYIIFFLDFFEIAFDNSTFFARIVYSLVALIIITPMSMINSFHFFYKWSIIANILTLLTICSVFELIAVRLSKHQIEGA